MIGIGLLKKPLSFLNEIVYPNDILDGTMDFLYCVIVGDLTLFWIDVIGSVMVESFFLFPMLIFSRS